MTGNSATTAVPAAGTYDHVPPGPVPPPDPAAPAGEFGFKFDRSGYRVAAIMVSPWAQPGSVYNDECRRTSLIATLRQQWGSDGRGRRRQSITAESFWTVSYAIRHKPSKARRRTARSR